MDDPIGGRGVGGGGIEDDLPISCASMLNSSLPSMGENPELETPALGLPHRRSPDNSHIYVFMFPLQS